ncbi:MAG: cell envelope integrity EipB family protein [Pseudomonadota bacterium]
MRRAHRTSGCGSFALSLLLSTALFAPGLGLAEAAPAVSFAPHQAVYDLSLKSSRGNASVNSARGRILYNFAGSACEGYTTEFRQVSQLDTGENKTTMSDLRSTSWEDGEGKTYRFKIETRMNEANTSSVDGVAERDGKTITVKLKQPAVKTFTIEGAVFPTEQVKLIIEAAREGKSLLELVVYDGSDDGEKIYNTLTVIGQPIAGTKATAMPDAATSSDKFKSLTRWPVTVSYYDKAVQSKTGEQTPVYAMSFELYEDGVSRALVLDYNDFVIAGAMGKIDVKETKPCK